MPENKQRIVAERRLKESIIEVLAAADRRDPEYNHFKIKLNQIIKLLDDIGIIAIDESERFQSDLTNQWVHEVNEYSVSTLGLKFALNVYREYGGKRSCGDWEIVDGTFSVSWELRYRKVPLIICNREMEYWPAYLIPSFDYYVKFPDKTMDAVYQIIQKEYPECHLMSFK